MGCSVNTAGSVKKRAPSVGDSQITVVSGRGGSRGRGFPRET